MIKVRWLDIGGSESMESTLKLKNFDDLNEDSGMFDVISFELGEEFWKYSRWYVQLMSRHLVIGGILVIRPPCYDTTSFLRLIKEARWKFCTFATSRMIAKLLFPRPLLQELREYGFDFRPGQRDEFHREDCVLFIKTANEDVECWGMEDILSRSELEFGSWEGFNHKVDGDQINKKHGGLFDSSRVSTANVVVLSPHPDDELIGCGGTLLALQKEGYTIHVIQLTEGGTCKALADCSERDRRSLRWREAEKVANSLGFEIEFWPTQGGYCLEQNDKTSARIIECFNRLRPDIVFVPSRDDLHPEHRLAWRVFHEHVEHVPQASQILEYPVWGLLKNVDVLVDVTSEIDEVTDRLYQYPTAMKAVDYVLRKRVMSAWLSGRYFNKWNGSCEAFAMYK